MPIKAPGRRNLAAKSKSPTQARNHRPEHQVRRIRISVIGFAVAWHRRGAPIVPLKPKGKEPWSGYSSRNPLSDERDIRAFFKSHPYSNYGVATGNISQLLVLDIDGAQGEKSLRALEAQFGPLPLTVRVNTGRGYHLYFKHQGDLSGKRNKIGEGLDIRAEGHYVVGAGSVHQTGKTYTYASGAHAKTTPIATLPDWLFGQITRKPAVVEANALIPDGQRNHLLAKQAGKLKAAGIGGSTLLLALKAMNEEHCNPPLEEKEVEKIARSIDGYAAATSARIEADVVATRVLQEDFAGGANLIVAPDGDFWRFAEGHWSRLDSNILKKLILKMADMLPDAKSGAAAIMRDVEAILKARVAVEGDPLRFNAAPPPVVNCENGELWLDTLGMPTLRPHRAESYLRHKLPITYDPDATCPTFDKALRDIFSSSSDVEGMCRLWHEIAGYVLQPSRRIPIIVVGHGGGSNGKSSLISILMALLGHDQVAPMRLKDLDRNQFSTARLLGKLMFVDDDVPAGTRLPDGDLKRICEEKPIQAERKFGEPFTFIVRTVPFLLCNNPLSLADLSEGMQRRLVIMPFDRKFKQAEIDTELFPRILRTELAGILNAALAGWQRVVARGMRFGNPGDVERAKTKWLAAANPLAAFIDECCNRIDKITVQAFYQRLQAWCQENGITMVPQRNNVKKNLVHLGFNVRHTNSGAMILGLSVR